MKLIWRKFQSFSQLINYTEASEMIRLSKWISMKSICSRREAQDFIKLGLVRVDGKRVFQNMLVPAEANLKAYTPIGLQVQKPITKLWMINKPRQYICTHKDPQRRKTIYQLFPTNFSKFGHLMTVGRLDFNSQGLLLVTNDNILKGLLQNPLANLTRFYRVKVHGRVTPQKIQKMNSPIQIKGITYGPLNVNIDRQLSTNVWLNVSMRTGKNRQIRRVMEKCDLQVNKLIRVAYGPYKIGSLNHGQIAQIPISTGLERKLKITKAKEIKKSFSLAGKECLIEIDIRNQAIGLAKQQLKLKQLQNDKEIPSQSKLIQAETEDE